MSVPDSHAGQKGCGHAGAAENPCLYGARDCAFHCGHIDCWAPANERLMAADPREVLSAAQETGVAQNALRVLGRPSLIFVFGDSHAKIFENVVLAGSDGSLYATRGRFITESTNARTFTTNDQIDPAIMGTFDRFGLFRYLPRAGTEAEAAGLVDVIPSEDRAECPIIYFCGDNDLRHVFLKKLGSGYDFVLPSNTRFTYPQRSGTDLITTESITTLALQLLQPLMLGLFKLRTMGFVNLMFHALAPPTTDDAAFTKLNGYYVPCDTRYRGAVFFNMLMEQFCLRHGIYFIDIWDRVTERGYLRPEFSLDHIHLNKKALGLSIEAAVANLAPAGVPAQTPAAPCAWEPNPGVEPEAQAWWGYHESFVARAQTEEIDLLFLGDSISRDWQTLGSAIWNSEFASRRAASFSIGGDSTRHLLWRLRNGEIDVIRPKLVVLLIGTINLPSDTTDDIVGDIALIVQELRTRLPESRILLLGILPRDRTTDSPLRQRGTEVNARIATFADERTIWYHDAGSVFLDESGFVKRALMPDFCHPSEAGYAIWAQTLVPAVKELLA